MIRCQNSKTFDEIYKESLNEKKEFKVITKYFVKMDDVNMSNTTTSSPRESYFTDEDNMSGLSSCSL